MPAWIKPVAGPAGGTKHAGRSSSSSRRRPVPRGGHKKDRDRDPEGYRVRDFEALFGERIARCEELLGYSFRRKGICALALNATKDLAVVVDGRRYVLPVNKSLAVHVSKQASKAVPRLGVT